MTPPRDRAQIAVAVVEHQRRWLIGRREAHGTLAGLWEFPGGKIEPGESPPSAAVRECLEETGVVVQVIGSYPSAMYDYEHAWVHLHFLACRFVEQQRPLPERFRWVTSAEFAGYEFPAANAALLALLSNAS